MKSQQRFSRLLIEKEAVDKPDGKKRRRRFALKLLADCQSPSF
jgi:hypothetical protein